MAKWSDVLPIIQEILPDTESVFENDGTVVAKVLDALGNEKGSVLRTSPLSDHILGFSGPTDCLLVFDRQGVLVAARILSSRDTRDHVQQVVETPRFLSSLNGRTRDDLLDLHDIDAVSGATLTSFAILESIRFRLEKTTSNIAAKSRPRSLKFPDSPRLQDLQLLFTNAARVEQSATNTLRWQVFDAEDLLLGNVLRASQVADNNIGYQGPTDLLIAVDSEHVVTGIALGESFDNDSYTGYVREDEYFRNLFNGQSLTALAAFDANTVEGVSGATMTSQSAARSLQMTAQAFVDKENLLTAPPTPAATSEKRQSFQFSTLLTLRNVSTITITCFGLILGLTHLRGRRWLRISFQCVLIGWLGYINGDMVSQALLLGWAQSGVPWRNAFGLTFLTMAALLVPIATGRNIYCSQLCPHGAIQQLVRRRIPWQLKLSASVRPWLERIPMLLLAWVVAIGMLHLSFSAVDIEPFDAWLWTIAGTATVAVAIIGLVASLFVPMAYCRFGCPTGALLNYVSHASGRSLNRRDLVAAVLLLVSVVSLCW